MATVKLTLVTVIILYIALCLYIRCVIMGFPTSFLHVTHCCCDISQFLSRSTNPSKAKKFNVFHWTYYLIDLISYFHLTAQGQLIRRTDTPQSLQDVDNHQGFASQPAVQFSGIYIPHNDLEGRGNEWWCKGKTKAKLWFRTTLYPLISLLCSPAEHALRLHRFLLW